jgi:hypothetical protein
MASDPAVLYGDGFAKARSISHNSEVKSFSGANPIAR